MRNVQFVQCSAPTHLTFYFYVRTVTFNFQINLREQHSIFKNKQNPLVKKWVVTLTKSGEISDSNLLKKAIDWKVTMDEVESKLKSFENVIAHKTEVYRS